MEHFPTYAYFNVDFIAKSHNTGLPEDISRYLRKNIKFISSPLDVEADSQTRIEFSNGNIYEGEICNMMMHGNGHFIWKTSGAFYFGVFQSNQITGSGILIWPNGSCYVGDLKNGFRDGYGILYHIRPVLLQKVLGDGKMPPKYAKYILYSASREVLESLYHKKYAGYWKDGLKSGKGRMDYNHDNSSFYDGDWLNGKPNGMGIRRYIGGSIYEGSCVNGLRHGFGELQWPERCESYSGEWSNGKQHGKGLYVWQIRRSNTTQYPSRNAYYGEWVDGKWEGQGVFFYPNGAKCMGKWREGKLNGKAVLELKNGKLIEAEFANDCIVRMLHDDIPETTVLFADPRIQTILPLNDALDAATDTDGQQECITLDTTEVDLREYYFVYRCKHKVNWSNELLKMRNVLFAFLKTLRHIYRFYAGLGVERAADNTQLLQRIQFWQFLRDCHLTTSMSICQVLNILAKAFGDCEASRKMFQPFEPMLFAEFASSLAIIAVTLFHEYDAASSMPHEAVKHLLDNFVSQHACMPSGGVYAEPQRTAILTPYFNDLYKLFEIGPCTLSFPPKDEIMTVRVFVKILQQFKILDSFIDLRQLLRLISETHPTVQTMDTFNLNSRLSFLEFVEILINCAETITRNEEKKRPKSSVQPSPSSRQGRSENVSRGSIDTLGTYEGQSLSRTKGGLKNTTRLSEKERKKLSTEGDKGVTGGRRISTNQNINSKSKTRRETSITQRDKKERLESAIPKAQSKRRESHLTKPDQDIPKQGSSELDEESSRHRTITTEAEIEVPPFIQWQQTVKAFFSERLLIQAGQRLENWSSCLNHFLAEQELASSDYAN